MMFMAALLARSASDRQMMTTQMKSDDIEYCIKMQQYFAITRLVLPELQPECGCYVSDPKLCCVVITTFREESVESAL
jgi:hypothetical protein